MITIHKTVDVEIKISLSDIATDDLQRELNYRGQNGYIGAKLLINKLEDQGCPREIIDQLWDWARHPVLTNSDLDRWKKFVGDTQ